MSAYNMLKTFGVVVRAEMGEERHRDEGRKMRRERDDAGTES